MRCPVIKDALLDGKTTKRPEAYHVGPSLVVATMTVKGRPVKLFIGRDSISDLLQRRFTVRHDVGVAGRSRRRMSTAFLRRPCVFSPSGECEMPVVTQYCAALGVLALSLGCVAQLTPGRHEDAPSLSGNSLVTAAELTRYTPGTSLLDALQRLRPTILYSRGTSALVSIDGTAPTDQDVLRSIPVSTVAEVRLLRATSSVSRATVLTNGDVVVGNVLLVITRK